MLNAVGFRFQRGIMRFILLYVVFYPVMLVIATLYQEHQHSSSSIGDYLVEPFLWAFLWALVPAILLSIFWDAYQKQKEEEKEKDEKKQDNE